MNLHEECLLKYLLNPLGLSISTEILKQTNENLSKSLHKKTILAKASNISYSTNRY